MSRFDRFMTIPDHPMLSKTYRQLNVDEKQFIRKFLVETVREDANTYAMRVNRLWLDEKVKPIHHAAMIEILLACNVVTK